MRKKLIPFLLAIAGMFCIVPVRGDDPPQKQQTIPLKRALQKPTARDLCTLSIQACYDELYSAIQTIVTSDLGQVEIMVTNLSTGEAWSDTFDSGAFMQNIMPISGTPGYYEIEYITESGDVYTGEFIIE